MSEQDVVVSLLSGFSDWVVRQSVDREYDYTKNYGCAFATYLTSLGYVSCWVGGASFKLTYNGDRHSIPVDIRMALVFTPWTYGALSKRLAR